MGATTVFEVRSSKLSTFQCACEFRTRFTLGSVRLNRAISKRPRSREVTRRKAVTSCARTMGSALNSGSSCTTKFSRSNPGRGSRRKCTEETSTGRPIARPIDSTIRVRKRFAPGRTRKSTSGSPMIRTASPRLERQNFTARSSRSGASGFHRRSGSPRATGTRSDRLLLFPNIDKAESRTTSK